MGRFTYLLAGVLMCAFTPSHAADTLSADGDLISLGGRVDTRAAGAVLHLSEPVAVVAHVANVVEPITSREHVFQLRGTTDSISRTIDQAARGAATVTVVGRLWWAGPDAPTPYFIEVSSLAPLPPAAR